MLAFSFSVFMACGNGTPKENQETEETAASACQDTGGDARAHCNGECPDSDNPNCYVRFRKAGSSDEWEKSGQSSMDRTPGIEYACYCDK